jgi:hypothetical protein
VRGGDTAFDVARLVHPDIARTQKFARPWGSGAFDGQQVGPEYRVADGGPRAARQIMLFDRKPRAASATQGFRLSAAQTVSSSGFTSFGFLVSGFGRSGCGLGRGRSITDFGSSPVRAFFIAHCEKNRSS